MAGFDNNVLYASNVDFTGTIPASGQITSDGQLLIGATASPNIRAGSLASTDSTLTITAGAGTLDLSTGATVLSTLTAENATVATAAAKNINIVGTTTNGINTTAAASTMTVSMASPYADGDFSFESQSGGTTRTLTIQNTVDAVSSQANQNISVSGITSGDVWTQYTIGTTQSWSLGIDNSDSDKYKITTTNSGTINPSSGTTILSAQTNGIITIPSNLHIGNETPTVPLDINIEKTNAGGNVEIEIRNLDNTNVGSNALVGIVSAGGSAGDPFYYL